MQILFSSFCPDFSLSSLTFSFSLCDVSIYTRLTGKYVIRSTIVFSKSASNSPLYSNNLSVVMRVFVGSVKLSSNGVNSNLSIANARVVSGPMTRIAVWIEVKSEFLRVLHRGVLS